MVAILEEEEEHENHERYLITYADMITLLMALFIILFAMSQLDLEKYSRFREGTAEAFNSPVLEGGAGILEGSVPVSAAGDGGEGYGGHLDPAEAEFAAAAISRSLDDLGLESTVRTLVDARGLVLVLSTDDVAFASGSWDLTPPGAAALDLLFGPLLEVDNEILVEGHTDSVPMFGGMTNWELSANRAGAVVRYLIDARGVAPVRLSAAGYADTRPLAPNTTEAGRRSNRRVEIVVRLDPVSDERVAAAGPTIGFPGSAPAS